MSIKEKKVNAVSSSNIPDNKVLKERKRADGKLKDSEEKYKSIVENINDVVFQLSPLGVIKYISPKVKEIYGYDAADLVGKHLKKTTPASELPKALKALKAVLSGRTVNNLEITQMSADGRIVHMEMNVVPLRRGGRTVGVQGVMRDISERKEAEKAAREAEERFKAIFDNSIDGILVTDVKAGSLYMCNKAMSQMLGYNQDEIKNLKVADIHPKEALPIVTGEIERESRSDSPTRREIPFRRKDGSVFYTEVTPSLITFDGKSYLAGIFRNVTERKQMEEALEKSEQKLRLMFESVVEGIIVTDSNGIINDCNMKLARMLGFNAKEDILGKNAFEFVAPQDREDAIKTLQETFEKGISKTVEYALITAEGSEFIGEVSGSVIKSVSGAQTGLVTTMRDVTERKRMEQALSESEERYRDLFENANDLIQSVAPDAHFIYVNRAWREALGYSEEEIPKFTLWDIIHPECLPGCKEIFLKVMAGEAMENVEVVFVTKNGKLITVEGNINSWSKGGKVLATRAIFRDVTERKRMEQELAEKNMKLEQASQAKSEFLASMSHELRTPLNAVIGFSELMLDGVAGEINDEQKDYLTDILESGEHLLNLINDVLDLSKLEAGKMELRVESLNLPDVITEAFQTVKPMADDKKLELTVNLQKGLPRVSADRTRLKQALLNLLSNSIKFTPAGGNITVEGSCKDEWCHVSVVDNGIGISEEDQKRIFQPFIQGKTSAEKAKEGTGLGLALSRKFIEACGGKIWVESEYGKGARFTFTLPLAKKSESHQEVQREKPAEVIHRLREIPLKPGHKTILVVDDDRKSRSLMEAWLREEGYAVVQASSGDEGIRQAKELMPAAIILDILMPDKDGWQVLQELKSTPKTRDIPVIIASVVEEKELSFSLGAVDYFVKPVNKKRFLERIDSLGVTRGKEVLVVDDNPADNRLVASILEAENIKVLRAYGGYEGLRIAREHKPALIVLDIVMPDICGFEVIERLREKEDTSHIPVIVFTVKDLTEDELNILSRHVAAIVRKASFKREDFLLEVRKAANMEQKTVRTLLKGKQ